MGRALSFWVVLSLMTVGAWAQAEESDCVRAYAQVEKNYEEKLKQLNEAEKTIIATGLVGTVGLGLCVKSARHWSVLAGCATAVTVGGLIFNEYHGSLQEKLELLQSQNRVYSVYKAIHEKQSDSNEIQILMEVSGVDVQREAEAQELFAKALEKGDFCSEGKASFTFEQVVEFLKVNRP